VGGGGTELNGFGGLHYGGALGPNLQYRVYGKYFDRDSTVLPDGQDASDDWHMGQGGFRMDWDASESNVFTVQGDGYDGRISQAGADDIDVSGANVIGRWSHTFYESEVGNTPVLAFLPSDVSRQWFSAFVQDEIALVKDRVHLTLGTKIEHNDYTGFEFQPSGRLAWRLSEQQTLWSAISRAVRTPSRIDPELFAPSSPPFLLAGGPDFDSETLLAYELGYRVQPLARLALSLAAWYNDYDDLRSLEQVSPPAASPIVIANGLEGESYGAELTADYRVTDWWRLRAGYTELRIDIRPKPGSTDTSNGSAESHDPEHLFSLRSSLDLPGHWELDAAFRYVSRIDNQQVPAYGELDVRLGWQPSPRLEFSIVGQNLLHDHHAEFGAFANARGEITRREIERGVYGKVLWRF
jgi:iron complex outermembrane receptor protein